MRNLRKYAHWYFLGGFALAALFIWSAVFRAEAHRGRTFLYVFDVGQGDVILTNVPLYVTPERGADWGISVLTNVLPLARLVFDVHWWI